MTGLAGERLIETGYGPTTRVYVCPGSRHTAIMIEQLFPCYEPGGHDGHDCDEPAVVGFRLDEARVLHAHLGGLVDELLDPPRRPVTLVERIVGALLTVLVVAGAAVLLAVTL